MVAFADKTGYPPLMSPQGKRLTAILAGSAVLFWVFGRPLSLRSKEKDMTPHGHPKDAMFTAVRPAKNADAKGSMPQAHRWV